MTKKGRKENESSGCSAPLSGPRFWMWLGFLAAVFLAHAAVHAWYSPDDAYISLVYSKHLAEHGSLYYHSKLGPVEGFTSFLWMLIGAFFIKLGNADPLFILKGVGIAVSLAVLLLSPRFMLSLAEKKSSSAPWLLPFLLATSPPFCLWAGSAMETNLFCALGLLGLWLATSGCEWAGGATLLLATLARPEGLLYFVAAVAALFFSKQDRKRLLGLSIAFVPLYVAYQAWRLWYFGGYPFPATYYAKVGVNEGFRQQAGGVLYLLQFLRGNLGILGISMALVSVWSWRSRSTLFRASLVLLGLYGVHIVRVGGEGMAQFRYFVPIVPFYYALVADGIGTVWDALRARESGAGSPALAACLLVALGAMQVTPSILLQLPKHARKYDGLDYTVYYKSAKETGEALPKAFPWARTLALYDAGALTYFSDMDVIDIVGLNNIDLAFGNHDYHRKHPQAKCEWGVCVDFTPQAVDYILGQKPDLFLIPVASDIRYAAALESDPRFKAEYRRAQPTGVPAVDSRQIFERIERAPRAATPPAPR